MPKAGQYINLHPYKYTIIATLCYLVLVSCATIVAPTGGPKDIAPPVIVSSQPQNFSTNFKGNKVIITFDEYVAIKDIEKQLIVSPPLANQPDIKVKGKSLVFHTKDTLRNNTTYNIFFGDAVADITENNKYPNLNFAFSTGPVIDSLSLAGQVTDAFTRLPVKEALVMLYTDFTDSVPKTRLPLYVTRTAVDGSFKLNSLARGKYRVIALKDANNDYMYNLPNEMVAFSNDSVESMLMSTSSGTDSTKKLNYVNSTDKVALTMFPEPDSIQRILKSGMVSAHKMVLIFRFPVSDFAMNPIVTPDTAWSINEWNRTQDTLQSWLIHQPDTLKMIVSEYRMKTDTLAFSTTLKSTVKQKPNATPKLGIGHTAQGSQLAFNKPLVVIFENPLQLFDTTALKLISTLKQDTVSLISTFTDAIKRHLNVQLPGNMSGEYKLLIPKGTFTDIYGITHDSLAINFNMIPREELGTFVVKLTTFSPTPLIMQLLSEKGDILDEQIIIKSNIVNFGYRRPGKYRLRAIYDANANHKWDTGVFLKKQQPETILIHPKVFEVRANWEMEEEWQL